MKVRFVYENENNVSKWRGFGMMRGTQHHRMLLEDIMGLSIGTEIVYLIHQSHNFIAGKNLTSCELGGLARCSRATDFLSS